MSSLETLPQSVSQQPLHSPGVSEQSHEQGYILQRLKFREVDNGEVTCKHPEIISSTPKDKRMHEYDTVDVVVEDGSETYEMTFGDYLDMIGVGYREYHMTAQQEESREGTLDHTVLLKRLHQRTIDYRTKRALELHKEYTAQEPRRDNYQEVTTKAHGLVFQKLFDDLGIDGIRVERSRPRDDYLNQIDEYLVLNPKLLLDENAEERSSDELFLGVQRSFIDKRDDMRREPWTYVPERSEKMKILRVGLLEKFKEYGMDDQGRGRSYGDALYDLRVAKAQELGTSPKETPMSPLYKVLGKTDEEGMARQQEWALSALHQIHEEIASMLPQQRTDKDRARMQLYLDTVESAIHKFDL